MQIKVPGKLFVMGEYSVTQTNHKAIICAIDKFVYADIDPSDMYEFSSHQGSFKWILDDQLPVLRYDVLKHAKAALYVTHQYLKHLNIKPKTYRINLTSELDDVDGNKYGLGSSGAVLVAVIKAILAFHQVKVLPIQIFKLAVLAQIDALDVTSGGELAASIYTGWVYYQKYDYLWVLNHKGLSMKLIDMKWPNLDITKFSKNDFDLAVCYTGYSQSTKDYVEKIASKDLKSPFYQDFLKQADILVDMFKVGLVTNQSKLVFESVDAYRNHMKNLSTWAELDIESSKLTDVIETAKRLNFHAKVSGAGHGDCGIVLIRKNENLSNLHTRWQEKGLIPLNLHVWEA